VTRMLVWTPATPTASFMTCANISGQLTTWVGTAPPRPGRLLLLPPQAPCGAAVRTRGINAVARSCLLRPRVQAAALDRQ
jgi:hypothetical protein